MYKLPRNVEEYIEQIDGTRIPKGEYIFPRERLLTGEWSDQRAGYTERELLDRVNQLGGLTIRYHEAENIREFTVRDREAYYLVKEHLQGMVDNDTVSSGGLVITCISRDFELSEEISRSIHGADFAMINWKDQRKSMTDPKDWIQTNAQGSES